MLANFQSPIQPESRWALNRAIWRAKRVMSPGSARLLSGGRGKSSTHASQVPANDNASSRSRWLRNTSDHLAETTVHISDLGRHACCQVAQHEGRHIAYVFNGHVAANG